MLTDFQRNAIISEIRSIFIVNNDNIPANAYIEELWRGMSTSQLYMALGNFRRMDA
jgi:isocitrate dehydrogenase kinase/phosphatase